MVTRDLAIGLIFFTQTTVGILGNFSLLCHYIILSFTEYRWRSTDFIHKHLIVANFLALFCKGVPQTVAAFGRKHFLSDIGLSIGSICILSVYQAITISPGNSRWAELKVKAHKYIFPSIFLCWVLQMLVNIIFPIYLTSTLSDKNTTNKKHFGYCSSVRHDKASDSLYGLLLSFPDVLCLGLMLWASSSMVFLLYRHKKQSRATKTILLLVSTFVYCYTLSSIFQVVLSVFDNPSSIFISVAAAVSECFPSISPFLLMSHNSKVPKRCSLQQTGVSVH
uniref:Vomeronasal type-1 receptor n=1 Tax=Panthera leo TaxID=9689 RepID=A0A8C8WSZ0_PANLE